MSTSSRPAKKISNVESKCAVAKQTQGERSFASPTTTVTGLTGRAILLASNEVDEYTFLLSSHHAAYLPVTEAESELVQTIADCEWRLRRYVRLQTGIVALGEKEFASQFAEEKPEVRKALITAQAHLTYERQLNTLSLQESRMYDQKTKAIAALEVLKRARPQKRLSDYSEISAKGSRETRAAAAFSEDGFDFSNPVKARKPS